MSKTQTDSGVNPGARELSPWWRQAVILILIAGFGVLLFIAIKTYQDAPPIPDTVVTADGTIIFTGADILAGQEVFLKYGLMENGTIWGHGAYLGPDFSADYLHFLALDMREHISRELFGKSYDADAMTAAELGAIDAQAVALLSENRYDPARRSLLYTPGEADSFQAQIGRVAGYFSDPVISHGLPEGYIRDPEELRQLTAFFAWTAWASVAHRPGLPYSYTNNFPYDPAAGNLATSSTFLWSALSLIGLLAGTAIVLFAFGRFDYLGWGKQGEHEHIPAPAETPLTAGQKGTLKFFALVGVLFFLQVMIGALVAHYRTDPKSFFGIDLSGLLPSNIARTWHLQTLIFWVATAYIAGGLFLAPAVARREPRGQGLGVNLLFGALLLVAGGSLLGEILGINQWLGNLWFWVGHQGWEYLDLGRFWQILLVTGLAFWVFLLLRVLLPARADPERKEISSLFLYAAVAIPLLYLPAMFFNLDTNYSIVDMWRFWIIHLWVEGFFELFVTVMVAALFWWMGLVSRQTAARVIYLDAILFLGSGLIGTGHHWYWTGQSSVTLGLGAVFSALEVIPLTLLTLDASNFIRLTRGDCEVCGNRASAKHRLTFLFLIAVGVWNFVGAGIFGFLINLPVVSYYEVGTMLTPNHGHTAFMGVFGMLAVALAVFALREALSDEHWTRIERLVKLSFWAMNIGLALMVATNLFPGGVLQLADSISNGYWHARGPEFLNQQLINAIEWARLPADLIFIFLGVVPLVIAILRGYWYSRQAAPRLEDSSSGVAVNN